MATSSAQELTADYLNSVRKQFTCYKLLGEQTIGQLAHYPYRAGQIVFIGKMICGENWIGLSIPRGNSKEYNADKFAQPKRTEHFTDELLR